VHLSKASGAAAARNFGIKQATSVWIAFLDSDDAWLPDKIERQMKAVSSSPDIAGVFTGIRYVPRIGSVLSPAYDYIPDTEINLTSLRRLNYLSSTSTALIRRSLLSEIGGFDESLPSCQDWDLWLRLAERGNLHLLRTALTLCSYENGDRISRNIDAVFEGHRSVFSKIYEADPRPEALRVNKAYHAARLAQIWLLDLNRPMRALKQAVSSFFRCPTKLSADIIRASIIKIIRSRRKNYSE
jgi:glycosyltransferase involved in cell wall biosynthesis